MQGATQIVSIVGRLVGEEYRQIRGVSGQVAELSDELDTMNAILRMLSDAEEGAVDHFIRVWMNQVRELAYDAEDCVHLYIFRIQLKRQPRDYRFLVWSKRIMATLFPRRRLARQIDALRARAVLISERHARYGVSREALLRGSTSLAAPALVSGYTLGQLGADDPDHLVGIKEQATKLAGMVNNKERGMKTKVFSIVGFGGLGKTTLATEVCRHLEVEFQRQAQVSVSQAFRGTKDLEGLLKRVLQQIVKPKTDNAQGIKEEDPLDGIDEMDVDKLARKLDEILKDIRYLIVVDDVWTISTWDVIRSKLPENNKGSRIIVTTRIETVATACSEASIVDGDCIYRIEPLNLEDSKKLFLGRAFGSKDNACPIGLEEELNKILKKCGGLPMAIISIAGLLANYKSSASKDMWERVCKSIGSHMESHPTLEGMRQIVSLSYSHLHHYLKGCMMYLSIFPEDYVIAKDRLLKRWIAEGLVADIRGLTLMEVAEAYYNELVSRSMIDRAGDIITWYDGRMEMCRVHDMMLEVMVSKSLESNFVSLVGGPYEGMSYDRIRRLSIHGGEEATKDPQQNPPPNKKDSPPKKTAAWHGRKNGVEGVKMKHVRSLSMFGLEDHTKVLDRLGEFTLLRVLDLEDCKGITDEHLRYICGMYLLRFLSLKGTTISEMPEEVGELENLEMLDVRETLLEDLPKTVTKLEKLEYLQIGKLGTNSGWVACEGVSRMKALRTVNKIVVGSDTDAAQEIGELQQLRELGIRVNVTCPRYLEVNQELAKSLAKIISLRWLNMGSRSSGDWVKDALDFLHDIKQPPRLLQYLRIGAGISKLPNWVGSLYSLVDLFIAWTKFGGDELFSPVCQLPNLQRMHLEVHCYTDRELIAKTAHTFPALKELSVDFNIDTMQAVRFQEKSMVALERLILHFSRKQNKSVFGIKHLTKLKEVKLSGYKPNSSLDRAVEQLKEENQKRPESNKLKVVVIHQ